MASGLAHPLQLVPRVTLPSNDMASPCLERLCPLREKLQRITVRPPLIPRIRSFEAFNTISFLCCVESSCENIIRTNRKVFITLKNSREKRGTRCNGTKCDICDRIVFSDYVKSSVTNCNYRTNKPISANCSSKSAVHLLTRKSCDMQYEGKTT